MDFNKVLSKFREDIDRYDDAWIPILYESLDNISALRAFSSSEEYENKLKISYINFLPLSETFIIKFVQSLRSYPGEHINSRFLVEYGRIRQNSPDNLLIKDFTDYLFNIFELNVHSILNILKARQMTVLGVAEVKSFLRYAPLDNERWKEIRKKNSMKADKYEINAEFLNSLFNLLHEESVAFQELSQKQLLNGKA